MSDDQGTAPPAEIEAVLHVAHKAVLALRYRIPQGFDAQASFQIGVAMGCLERALDRVRKVNEETDHG